MAWKVLLRAIGRNGGHGDFRARANGVAQAGDVEDLLPAEAEGRGAFAFAKLQGQHAHSHQVAAMDALVGFRQHGAHAEQQRSFRRPVAR